VLAARNKLTITDWGAKLRPDVAKDRDFKLLSEEIWTALHTWYGGGPALPRPLFREDGKVSVEIHPLTLKIMHHTSKGKLFGGLSAKLGMDSDKAPEDEKLQTSLWFYTDCSCNDTVGRVVKMVIKAQAQLTDGRRDASNVGARLWDYANAKVPVLLSDERVNVADAGISDNHPLLLEIRNADLSWPSEMLAVARASALSDGVEDVSMDPAAVDKADGKRIKGLTGLSNLGNTCFMNSALQCLSHTSPLTEYCLTSRHFMELNVDNPLGYKGVIARRYGDLVRQLYAGRRSVAPLKLRSAIQELAPLFAGNQQHDAQELLAFVLDGLHEDLNRVTEKPYVERKDSNDRPDAVVAREHWHNHVARNRSIMVDLFHFQLRSQLKCMECGFTSVTFDPVSSLPLPLPSEGACTIELSLQRLDGKAPIKYALEVEPDCDYLTIKQSLAKVCNLSAEQMIVADVVRGVIIRVLMDREKCHAGGRVALRVFEVDLACKMAGIAQVRAARRLESLQRASVGEVGEEVLRVETKGKEATAPKRSHSDNVDEVDDADKTSLEESITPTSPRAKRVLSDSNPFKLSVSKASEDNEPRGSEDVTPTGDDSADNADDASGTDVSGDVIDHADSVSIASSQNPFSTKAVVASQPIPSLNGGDAKALLTTAAVVVRPKQRSASLTEAEGSGDEGTRQKAAAASAPPTPMKKKEYPTMAGSDAGKPFSRPALNVLGRARIDQYVVGHLVSC
jgi:ubiquitin C-terminal hydrolase